MPALSPEHLQIPLTAAAWYWGKRRGRCRALGIDLDELTGMAGLALSEAVANYDLERSPTGERHYGSYLVQQVRWRLNTQVQRRARRGRNPRRSPASLSAELGEDFTLADTLAAPDPSLAAVEAREMARMVLARLGPSDRETARRVWMEGLTLAEAGRRLGLSQQAVSIRLMKVRERIERAPTFRRWAKEYQR